MTLRVRSALANGIPRVFRRNGLLLIGAYLLVSLLQGGLIWMIVTTALPLGGLSAPASGAQTPNPGSQLSPLTSLGTLPIAMFTGGILTIPMRIVMTRTLVSDLTDHIPEEVVFHRLGWATFHRFVSSWLVTIGTGLLTIVLFGVAGWGLFNVAEPSLLGYLIQTWPGRALLVVGCVVLLLPAFFFGVSLIFVGQEIAIKDKNVLGAIRGSWKLARGNRLRLLALALLPFVFQMILSILVFEFLPSLPGQALSFIMTAIVQTAVIAIMARAYVQVHSQELELNYLGYEGNNTKLAEENPAD